MDTTRVAPAGTAADAATAAPTDDAAFDAALAAMPEPVCPNSERAVLLQQTRVQRTWRVSAAAAQGEEGEGGTSTLPLVRSANRRRCSADEGKGGAGAPPWLGQPAAAAARERRLLRRAHGHTVRSEQRRADIGLHPGLGWTG